MIRDVTSLNHVILENVWIFFFVFFFFFFFFRKHGAANIKKFYFATLSEFFKAMEKVIMLSLSEFLLGRLPKKFIFFIFYLIYFLH